MIIPPRAFYHSRSVHFLYIRTLTTNNSAQAGRRQTQSSAQRHHQPNLELRSTMGAHLATLKVQVKEVPKMKETPPPVTGSEYFDTTNKKWYTPVMLSREFKASLPPAASSPLSKEPGPRSMDASKNDIFDQLEINPLKEVNNVALLSGYVTSMGKIKTRRTTCLTQKSQRLVGKAIRRARHMGIIPWMSRSNHVL